MKPTIKFRFEKLDVDKPVLNYTECYNLNREKIGNFMMEDQKGFRFSQVVDSMLYFHINNPNSEDTIEFEHIDSNSNAPYIIPVAVQYNPLDWADVDFNGNKIPNRKSIFEFIHPTYLKDLRDGKALFLIDQSVEGYSAKWLWQWFHNKCDEYKINPSCIIYATGDQKCTDTYNEWCSINTPTSKLKVIPSISLSMYVHKHCIRYNVKSNFNELLDHKRKNKENIYLYDCTNMRPRPQRVLNFLHLLNAGLLDKGNISMAAQKDWDDYINLTNTEYLKRYKLPADIFSKLTPEMTPRVAKYKYDNPTDHYYNFVERVLDDLYKNSWVSLITESSYFDFEFSAFISEKTFKPIACMQPFIIVGSKDTIKYFHRLGYKSFNPHIDETYDDVSDANRFLAILNTLNQIDKINDKVEWYESMRDIVEHNYHLFMEIGNKRAIEHTEISNYYFEYFKDKNV